MLTRREFGLMSAGLALGYGRCNQFALAREPIASVAVSPQAGAQASLPRFDTVGVVLYPWDLSLTDWPASTQSLCMLRAGSMS